MKWWIPGNPGSVRSNIIEVESPRDHPHYSWTVPTRTILVSTLFLDFTPRVYVFDQRKHLNASYSVRLSAWYAMWTCALGPVLAFKQQ